MLEQPLAAEPVSAPPTVTRRRIGALAAAVAVVAVLVVAALALTSRSGDTAAPAGQASDTVESDGGGVTVAATWLRDQTSPAFTVALDTHSVDLDGIDLREQAVLRVNGTEYRPTRWDAPRGGHHREGTLAFGTAQVPEGATVELVVRDVAGVAERTLTWTR